MMIGDMAVVVEKMAAVVNKEGSAMEVPWAMMAKFVGFMSDSSAHNFEFKYLVWIFKRDFQVRMGGRKILSIRQWGCGRGRRSMRWWVRLG